MHKLLYLIGFTLILFSACKPNVAHVVEKKVMSEADVKEAIGIVLKAQSEAWSEGDIDGFMEGYWKSEDLTFIGRSGVNKGWQTTKDNYIKGYPDKAAMGTLTFETLELVKLTNELYRMVGRYTLVREKDKPTGIFTLLWQYIDGEWVVIYDHTSG
jgi:hypothetical protein